MRIMGILFVVSSAAYMGCQMAIFLRRRCELFQSFLDCLQLLQNEIQVCGTPLPQAFALMAASCDGVLEEIFSAAAKDMDQNRWVTPYDAINKAMEQQPEEQLQAILLPMARKLGRYDLDAQLQGIETARREAERVLEELEQERKIRSRTYRTLGLCAGLAMAILLI